MNTVASQASKPGSAARALWLLSLLVIAWLLWSGLYKPLLLGLGAFSCVLTLYIAKRMALFDGELFALRFGTKLCAFWLWLAREVVLSSLEVARVVLNPKLPISPTVVEFDATATHPVDQAILGNSITLTPGTIALDVHEGHVVVHALTSAGAAAISDGEMDRRVAKLRGS